MRHSPKLNTSLSIDEYVKTLSFYCGLPFVFKRPFLTAQCVLAERHLVRFYDRHRTFCCAGREIQMFFMKRIYCKVNEFGITSSTRPVCVFPIICTQNGIRVWYYLLGCNTKMHKWIGCNVRVLEMTLTWAWFWMRRADAVRSHT